jgi:hypothetical protein
MMYQKLFENKNKTIFKVVVGKNFNAENNKIEIKRMLQ